MKKLVYVSLLLFFSSMVGAAEPVGKVILSFGQNYALNTSGEERVLKRQAEIFADDLLKTSAKGRLQVRFSDGSRLSLKPATEFRIAEYSFDKSKPDDGKAIYKLLKGGMRTISGKIGKVNKENYRLETVVATIGIRGTHYGTEFTPDGLYTETLSGAVVVETKEGITQIGAGESVQVNSRTGKMTKGKATGQTAQGEEEDSSGENSEEGSEGDDSEQGTGDDDGSETEDEGSSNASSEEGTSGDSTEGSNESNASTGETSGGATSDEDSGSTLLSGGSSDSNGSTGATAPPATNPNTGGTTQTILSSPDPTGNGTAAPAGGMTLVAFIDNDSAKGQQDSNGIVYVNDKSSITIDSSTGQDRVTGILYVDTKLSSTDNCNPCTVTAPVDQSLINDDDTQMVGGAKLSWGRWNKDSYSLLENGTTQQTLSDFHYMYSDSKTSATAIAAKTGSYVYAFKIGNPITIPQFEDGTTGELVPFSSRATLPAGGSVRLNEGTGTYLQVDWDSQKIIEVGLHILEKKTGNTVNTYQLTEELNAGAYVDTALSDVLNGGELKLSGSCYGSGTCGSTTTLEGRMNVELIGGNAEGAAISYGASGSSTGTTTKDISVVGTALLTKNVSAASP